MKQCKDCKFEYGWYSCAAKKQWNEVMSHSEGLRNRKSNREGKCPDYVCIWWKFWRPK